MTGSTAWSRAASTGGLPTKERLLGTATGCWRHRAPIRAALMPVNDRVRSVCRFYSWAHRRGLIDTLPFDYVDESRMMAHLDHRRPIIAANVLTISEAERLPRPLRVDQLQALFSHLDAPYGLIAEWALATGMHRKELCGLKLQQVPEGAHLDIEEDPLVGVPLTITKGDRPRTVYPPLRLIARTHGYAGEERAALLKRLRTARPRYRSPATLFLNSKGDPITRARLSAVFGAAFRGRASPDQAIGCDTPLRWRCLSACKSRRRQRLTSTRSRSCRSFLVMRRSSRPRSICAVSSFTVSVAQRPSRLSVRRLGSTVRRVIFGKGVHNGRPFGPIWLCRLVPTPLDRILRVRIAREIKNGYRWSAARAFLNPAAGPT